MGTQGGGLNRFDSGTGRFTSYQNGPTDTDTLLTVIFEDRAGLLWLGYQDGGLSRFDPKTEQFTVYRHSGDDLRSLSHNKVNAIREDRQERLWIVTESGLNLLDRSRGTFTSFTTKDGLPDNAIKGMLEDAQGYLWLATYNGLSRFHPLTTTFRNYSESDGLPYWRNASRGFDAVQAVTNWDGLSATAFAASQVVIGDNGLGHHQPGNDLYGLDGKLTKFVPKATVEPFVFWRLTPGLKTEEGTSGHLDEKTAGVRFAGTILKGWDYDTEGARQFGSLGVDRVRAWAWMGIGGYTFTNLRVKTRLFGEYDFASGDGNSKDGVRGTFDQLFPNVHDHLGLADQFGWQNLKAVRAGARIWLRRDWIVAPIWNNYWLANATDGFYNSSGTIVARDPKGLSGSHVGEEYDIQTSYRFDRNLEFGVGFARVLPGEFLLNAKHPASYSYPYLMMSYNFF